MGTYSDYDVSTAIGQVRLYLDDRDLSAVGDDIPAGRRSAIFSDEELQVFLDVEGGDPMLATARGLVTIANNKSLMVQRRDIDGTTVDYGALRADLLKAADSWRQQAIGAGSQSPADAIAEQSWTDFGARRIVVNADLRGF